MAETMSRTSNAYAAKHGASGRPKRMQSAHPSSKQANSRFSKSSTKAYYPDDYYKRVGYNLPNDSTSKQRTDALGQRVRERFNEELSYTD